jgi:putative DNA primase/helicase
VWRPEKDKGRGGWDKPPIDPHTGGPTDATDAAAWMSFEGARALARDLGAGIGLALGDDGPYCGVDLDKVIDDRGEVAGWARDIVDRLASYTEVTPSGKGLRVWVKGRLPRDGKGKSKHRTAQHSGLEFYDSGRYFTVTGNHYPGTPTTIEDRATVLAELHAEIFGARNEGRSASKGADLADDDTLIETARAAKNGPKFAALFDAGDTRGYGGDDSAADFALASLIGFWTGNDPDRVERIFNRSALGQRDKWRERADYREMTIRNALDGIKESYTPRGRRPGATPSMNGHATPGTSANRDLDARLAGFPWTELGNAERLVARFGEDLRHVGRWKKFLTWDGRRWRTDFTGRAMRRAKTTVRLMLAEAATITHDDPKTEAELIEGLTKWAHASEKKRSLDAMLALAATEKEVAIEHDVLDSHRMLLNTKNGTIDLRDGSLNKHRYEDMITHLSPVEYDRDAECPLWDSTLERAFDNDQEMILFIGRLAGVFASGKCTEHILPIFHGEGNNGKSTILKTLMGVLGDDLAMPAMPGMLMLKKHASHPTEIAILRGKRLIVAMESGENERIDEEKVKYLTGNDRITTRGIGEDPWSFDPSHTIVMCTNHKPVIRGTDLAIWRRLLLIPFTVCIPREEIDKDMPEKLRAEYPGILAWMIRGCLEWQRKGLNPPEKVLVATKEYRESQDILQRFYAEACIISTAHGIMAKAAELYNRFKSWAERSGEHEIMSSKEFGERIKADQRFKFKKTDKCNLYHGIGLRPE